MRMTLRLTVFVLALRSAPAFCTRWEYRKSESLRTIKGDVVRTKAATLASSLLPARELCVISPINHRIVLQLNLKQNSRQGRATIRNRNRNWKINDACRAEPRVKKLNCVRGIAAHIDRWSRLCSPGNPKNNRNPFDRLTARFKKRLRAPANYQQNPISNFPGLSDWWQCVNEKFWKLC